jgi:hypothetical protein
MSSTALIKANTCGENMYSTALIKVKTRIVADVQHFKSNKKAKKNKLEISERMAASCLHRKITNEINSS